LADQEKGDQAFMCPSFAALRGSARDKFFLATKGTKNIEQSVSSFTFHAIFISIFTCFFTCDFICVRIGVGIGIGIERHTAANECEFKGKDFSPQKNAENTKSMP